MCRCTCWLAVGLLFVLVICLVLPAEAQDVPPQGSADEMAAALKYSGVENLARGDVDRMLELWRGAQVSGLTMEQRVDAYRSMYVFFYKLMGRDMTGRPQALTPLAQFAATAAQGGARMDLRLPAPRGVPQGRYVHFDTFGKGPVHLLLLPGFGLDGPSSYNTFIQRNLSRYTMHVVTFPFCGKARPLPWPEVSDYAALPWMNQMDKELVEWLDKNGKTLPKLVVVGTTSGGYFGARLALERPAALRALVLVDALVNVTMRSAANPDAPAPLKERLQRIKFRGSAPQFFPLKDVPSRGEIVRLLEDPKSTDPSVQNWMNSTVREDDLSKRWTVEALTGGFFIPGIRMGAELQATDLTEAFGKDTVPTLVMSALHDDGSRQQSPASFSQWQEIKLRNPAVPMKLVAFADTRSFISEDRPSEFDAALEDFLTGRGPRGYATYSLPRASPLARVTQWLGKTEVSVEHGRPRVNNRKVWGELVPYGRVWRSGANEATRITFSTPVTVEGKSLPAGTYTFFTIPGEKEWTVIFNRITMQWGAFDYNQEFDALRFTVTPSEAPHQEYLNYAIDIAGTNTGRVILRWEKVQIAFTVEGEK